MQNVSKAVQGHFLCRDVQELNFMQHNASSQMLEAEMAVGFLGCFQTRPPACNPDYRAQVTLWQAMYSHYLQVTHS